MIVYRSVGKILVNLLVSYVLSSIAKSRHFQTQRDPTRARTHDLRGGSSTPTHCATRNTEKKTLDGKLGKK